MQQLSAVEKASLRRYMYLLEKVQGNKPLTVAEIKELDKYENDMKKKIATENTPVSAKAPTRQADKLATRLRFASTRQASKKAAKSASKKKKISPASRNDSGQKSAVNLAAMLKQMAFEGKTIAQIETELPTSNIELSTSNKNKKTKTAESAESASKSLNDLFAAKPELKAAFERGRFLKNLAECAASGATIADAEHDLDMPAGELDKILAADTEAADIWNQSIRKTLNKLRRQMLDKVDEASVPALKIMYSMLRKQIVSAPADLTHLTWLQISEITGGKSRMTVQSDWPTKYGCPRNADGTYNLKDFVPWYVKFEIEKLPPGKTAVPEALRDKKAEMLDIELKEKIGQLLDRKSVVAGLLGREQLDKNMYDKLLDKVPGLVENQPMERIRKILEEAYLEIKNEKTKYKIELKLGEEAQKLFDSLMEKI